MSTYYIQRGGRNLGPYAAEQVVSLLRAHQLSLDDLCVEEGAEDWQPLGNVVDPEVLAVAPAPAPAPVAQPSPLLPPPMPYFNPDKVQYTGGDITVSNTRVVVGAQTFALANISSVKIECTQPTAFGAGFVAAVGGVLAISGLGSGSSATAITGIIALVIGVLYIVLRRYTYWLLLTAAGGEARACSSKDPADIQRVVAAIERAIVERA
jgi:hypothetical protein